MFSVSKGQQEARGGIYYAVEEVYSLVFRFFFRLRVCYLTILCTVNCSFKCTALYIAYIWFRKCFILLNVPTYFIVVCYYNNVCVLFCFRWVVVLSSNVYVCYTHVLVRISMCVCVYCVYTSVSQLSIGRPIVDSLGSGYVYYWYFIIIINRYIIYNVIFVIALTNIAASWLLEVNDY